MTDAATTTDTTRVDMLVDDLLATCDPTGDRFTFRGEQYERGLAWVWFPEGFGGLGAPAELQRRVDGRLREAGASSSEVGWNGFGLFLAAPTIVAHADDALKTRLLRPLFAGEAVSYTHLTLPTILRV